MASCTITFSTEAETRILNAFALLYPIPQTPFEPGEVSTPLYTKKAWAMLQIEKWLKHQVRAAEERASIVDAKAQVNTVTLSVD
jgi:hypothetical protein